MSLLVLYEVERCMGRKKEEQGGSGEGWMGMGEGGG